jgi:hypothetical protein
MADNIFGDDDCQRKILHCTPEAGARIEDIAKAVVRLIKSEKADGAEIEYPEFTIEVDKTATEKDILASYYKMRPKKVAPSFGGRPRQKPPGFGV